jgi:hypothetical protein
MKAVVNVKFLILGTFIMSLLLVAVGVFFTDKGDQKILNYNFSGRVDSVWYDENRAVTRDITKPFVTINSKTYYLFSNSWELGHKIQKGDSLIKKENTMTITLIKKNGRKFVFEGN